MLLRLVLRGRHLGGKLLEHMHIKSAVLKLLLLFYTYMNKVRFRNTTLSLVLWPPAKKHFDDIECDISRKYQVTDSKEFLISEDHFTQFVREVYAIDGATQKFAPKIPHLFRPPLVIRLLEVWIPHPTLKPRDMFNNVRCRDIWDLKMEIRQKYQDTIENYMYDLIIHSAEDQSQSAALREIIERFSLEAGVER